jgi:hypothetical protein
LQNEKDKIILKNRVYFLITKLDVVAISESGIKMIKWEDDDLDNAQSEVLD